MGKAKTNLGVEPHAVIIGTTMPDTFAHRLGQPTQRLRVAGRRMVEKSGDPTHGMSAFGFLHGGLPGKTPRFTGRMGKRSREFEQFQEHAIRQDPVQGFPDQIERERAG